MKLIWPNDSRPELPTKAYSPTTTMMLMNISIAVRLKARLPNA